MAVEIRIKERTEAWERARARLTGEYCRGYPPGALAEIARDVGLSRERVRQIAKSIGITRLPDSGLLRGAILEYADEGRICPECGSGFVWTARAQLARARNVRNGLVRAHASYEPTCSPACTTRRSRRRQRGAWPSE